MVAKVAQKVPSKSEITSKNIVKTPTPVEQPPSKEAADKAKALKMKKVQEKV
tara:strand:+ start:18 stop:173 length:156 start_codon:yes stop_codon:yes gene_type:complete